MIKRIGFLVIISVLTTIAVMGQKPTITFEEKTFDFNRTGAFGRDRLG